MFYSRQLLQKKGPFGTVWRAAHHKLKKSHYISTKFPSIVEQIMHPPVLIALRLSGHLLLGVVCIYSKQADYLYEDCNEMRIKINRVFPPVSINLPDDATHAPFQSVTLPQKLNLDSFELDDYCNEWSVDSHLKSQDDITLEGQIPTGRDPYIAVPMEEDLHPLGADDINVGNRSPQEPSSIEIMRDATRHENLNNSSPILPDRAEPDKFLEEQIVKDKQTSTPVTDGVVSPDARFSFSHNHEEQHSSMPFVHRSPEMRLRPTPPPAAQPRVRRKRKRVFDKSTVLSNKHMKKALNDTSDILRVWKSCPLSSLTIWKSNMRSKMRKGGVFYDPFITGSCADLQRMYEDDFVSAKPHLSTLDTDDTGVEFHRNNDFASPDRNMFFTDMPSPNERSYLSPLNTNTADMGASGNLYSDIPASPGGLGFLGQDDNSPAGSHATPGFGIFPNNQETPERQRLFDESTVLSNEHMKKALNDTSGILRVWKNCPLSSLTIRKSNMRLKMRNLGVCYDPFITGSCADLRCMYEDDFISAKPYLSRRDTDDAGYEFHRNNDFASPNRNMSFTDMPSPNERSYLSPLNMNRGLQSERFESNEWGGTFHTADMGTSGNRSPGELGFLAQDDNSPAGSHATPGFGIFPNNQETPELQRLSPRTRAVAQYLKWQSSATPILGSSEESSSYLSLNKILEGKPRKICARMFFETLVLKSYGLVDVHQDQKKPYDVIRDITLKVTPKQSK